MAAGPAPELRPLMDQRIYLDYFNNRVWQSKTYLCYEVECPEGDFSIPLEEQKGWLHNQPYHHAEWIFLEQMASWKLDKGLRYRVTCYISYTPCEACAYKLAAFLRENTHVDLHIFAARIYVKKLQDWKAGLRALKAAGAEIAMMTFKEFEHCWKNFVDHKDKSFSLEVYLDIKSEELSRRLRNILQNQEE